MKAAAFQHVVRSLDIGSNEVDYAFVFTLASGDKIVGYCDPSNVGDDLGVVLVMNDGHPELPANIFVEIAAIVAVHLEVVP